MGRLRYILLLLVLLAVALFTRWLLQSVEPQGVALSPDQRHTPDYFVSDFAATVFDEAGKPYYKLKSNRMEHFPDDETVTLQFPEIQFLRESTLPWLMVANNGTVYQKRDVVELTGNVVLTREAANINQRMQLKTQAAQIDLTRKRLDTDSEVHIQAKSSNISAKGMHIDLIKGTLVLDANARGVYVP